MSKSGYIRQIKDGVWSIEVTVGTSATGKRLRKYRRVYGTRQDAEEELSVMLAEFAKTNSVKESVTLGTYWRSIFPKRPSVRGTLRSESTTRFYTKHMKLYILPILGQRPLEKITHADARCCILASKDPSGTKRTLSAVLRSAYDDGLMSEKPMSRRIPIPKKRKEQLQPWTRFEVSEVIHRLDEMESRVQLYVILGLAGLRREEVLGARPMDIVTEQLYSAETGENIQVTTITISQTFTDEGGLRQTAKNDHSLRTVPILPSLAVRLNELTKNLPEQERCINMSASGFAGLWRKTIKKLGIRYLPPDMLRHTTDTLALTAGIAPDLNDKMHGRSEHTSTYRHYFRPDISSMAEAVAAIDGLVRRAEAEE